MVSGISRHIWLPKKSIWPKMCLIAWPKLNNGNLGYLCKTLSFIGKYPIYIYGLSLSNINGPWHVWAMLNYHESPAYRAWWWTKGWLVITGIIRNCLWSIPMTSVLFLRCHRARNSWDMPQMLVTSDVLRNGSKGVVNTSWNHLIWVSHKLRKSLTPTLNLHYCKGFPISFNS